MKTTLFLHSGKNGKAFYRFEEKVVRGFACLNKKCKGFCLFEEKGQYFCNKF